MRSKLNLIHILINLLAKPKISELDFSFVKEDVLGFEVEMNHFRLLGVKVGKTTQNLEDDEPCLLLRKLAMPSHVFRQIRSLTKLQYCAERVIVYLYCVNLLHDSGVMQVFMDLCLSNGIPHVSDLLGFTPFIVEGVYL